ncbi:MAG: Na+/H+ antiporter NhaC family protein [Gemmatimonadota bacterium]|nr:Na+/H+ antiporter NhaC family protein [Gemmatimonadota bacterium]
MRHRQAGHSGTLVRRRVAALATLTALAGALSAGPASAAPVPVAPPQADSTPRFALETPRVLLASIPFGVSVRATAQEGVDAVVALRVVTARGRELARGTLEPSGVLELEGLVVHGGDDLPLRLLAAPAGGGPDGAVGGMAAELPDGTLAEARVRVLPGWTSLLPPLVAILMALVFREVVTSLFVGVWLGAFFAAGLNPLAAFLRTMDRFVAPALAHPDHASILVFSFLLGGMVGVMSRSGGTRGIVEAVRPIATTPRRAQLATYLAGLAIFFDDYANTLIVGNTMRPITDRMRVSREKLAYLVDSTAAPVASIVFVSTWVGFEISLIGDGLAAAAAQAGTDPAAAGLLDANPFTVFIHSIPYLFYPLLALLMVGLVVFLQRDFGPMWKAENRASRGEGLVRDGAMPMTDTGSEALEPDPGAPLRWWNAALPVLTVVAVVLSGLWLEGRANLGRPGTAWEVLGEADPFHALLWGSLAGCLVAVLLPVSQRILTMEKAIQALVGGMRAMLLAGIILVLAWSLSEVTVVLGTARYLAGILAGSLRPEFLPVLVFLTSAAISFATGTSWGTMAILIPLVIPLSVALGGAADFDGGAHYTVLLGAISSVLAGAIFGDHCSPISDTTVMSSMASGCDHVDHVRTQLPYALLVAGIGMAVGDIPTAFGMPPWISYALGAAALFLVLRFLGRRDDDSPQWSAEARQEVVAG